MDELNVDNSSQIYLEKVNILLDTCAICAIIFWLQCERFCRQILTNIVKSI